MKILHNNIPHTIRFHVIPKDRRVVMTLRPAKGSEAATGAENLIFESLCHPRDAWNRRYGRWAAIWKFVGSMPRTSRVAIMHEYWRTFPGDASIFKKAR